MDTFNEEYWQSQGVVVDMIPEEINITRYTTKTNQENVTLSMALRLVSFGMACGFVCEGVVAMPESASQSGSDYLLRSDGILKAKLDQHRLNYHVKWKGMHAAMNVGRTLTRLKDPADTATNNMREFISMVLGHALDGTSPSQSEIDSHIPNIDMAIERAAGEAIRRYL